MDKNINFHFFPNPPLAMQYYNQLKNVFKQFEIVDFFF